MSCSSCHNPHAAGESMLTNNNMRLNDLCYTCHQSQEGPFVFEHAPVVEDCGICHTPHGADTAAPVPLWNKVLNSNPGNYTRYSTLATPTFDSLEAPVGSVSLACLSCHDGTVALGQTRSAGLIQLRNAHPVAKFTWVIEIPDGNVCALADFDRAAIVIEPAFCGFDGVERPPCTGNREVVEDLRQRWLVAARPSERIDQPVEQLLGWFAVAETDQVPECVHRVVRVVGRLQCLRQQLEDGPRQQLAERILSLRVSLEPPGGLRPSPIDSSRSYCDSR